MRILTLTSTFTALVAILATGCGTPSSGGGTSPSGGGQESPFPLASLDATCFGITGKMVLSTAEPQYATTLTYMGTEPNAGTTTPLTIHISYEQGAITCNPPHSTGVSGPSSGADVSVQVRLDFVTGDGAFAETLDAALDGFDASQAQFTASVAANAIAGTYKPNLSGATNVTVELEGSVAGPTTHGGVNKTGKTSAVSSKFAFVASW
jgi:hypothetical protein